MFFISLSIGIIFIIFWAAQLIFVKTHLKWSEKIVQSNSDDKETPVTIIHPIKDLDYELESNLESWLTQNYSGKTEHIFSFQTPDDPAIAVVKRLIKKHKHMDLSIIVNPVKTGLSGKSSNMSYGISAAKYDMLLFGDSDTRVKEDFIVKMIRPLRNQKVGVTTCGQINIGGNTFWTRFFTFLQNCETDFCWAFFTKLGIDVGITGAAFAMRRDVINQIGGLEQFGSSLLEDMFLGNTLYKMGYKIILGPFVECHVDKLDSEKSFNYAKRLGIGIKMHVAVELPAFIIMLSWYWILLIIGLATVNLNVIILCLGFICIRIVTGIFQRTFTKNRYKPIDIIMPLFFDLFGTFYLVFSMSDPYVTWRGITYKVKNEGYIDANNNVDVELETEQVH